MLSGPVCMLSGPVRSRVLSGLVCMLSGPVRSRVLSDPVCMLSGPVRSRVLSGPGCEGWNALDSVAARLKELKGDQRCTRNEAHSSWTDGMNNKAKNWCI